jgi:glycosyltransferase involved in cell wall biosynthesis
VIANAPSLQLGDASPPAGPYLLGVGDLRAKKDFVTLVRAWRRLRAQGLPHRLVLAGIDGGEGARLRAEAGAEPLELTGYIEDAWLDALMRGAELLVHPSLHEGFGLVLLEAMARGVPIVAARASALPETAGDAALYFEPGQFADLEATISRVLSEPALRARLVARGSERVAGYSWEATARATADVYRELL